MSEIKENISLGNTGTLADLIHTDDNLPVYLDYDPEEDEITKALWESYDSSTRRYLNQIREATAGKRTAVYKFFYDTIEAPETRTWANFNDLGYNELNLSNKDYNDAVFAAKSKSKEQLERLIGAATRGPYVTPVTVGDKVIDPANDSREDFNDEEASKSTDRKTQLLTALRQGVEDFTSEAQSVEATVNEKYAKLAETAERVASGRALKQHAFIYGDPGIGKTFTVKKAIEKGQQMWRGSGSKPQIIERHGAVGSSLTAVLIFFFMNKDKKIILLDDAEGFLLTKDEDINNFFKAILDPDVHGVTTPVTVRNRANKLYADEISSMAENNISITLKPQLKEGKATVVVNGKQIKFNVTPEEFNSLKEALPMRKPSEKEVKLFEATHGTSNKKLFDKFGKLITIKEADLSKMDFDAAYDEEDRFGSSLSVEDTEDMIDLPTEIPATWIFTSALIMVSNLEQEDVNDAVRSRCDCRGIHLSKEEFMFRTEQILDKLKMGSSTLTEPKLVNWAKYESFALLKACMDDLNYKNSKIHLVIGIRLEFRIIPSLAGLLLARFDRWVETNGIKDYLNDEVLARFEKEQAAAYLIYDLLPFMKGDRI